MYSKTIATVSALAAVSLVSAQDPMVPSACQAICEPVVELTSKCAMDMSMMAMMNMTGSKEGMNMDMNSSKMGKDDDNADMPGMDMSGMDMGKKRQTMDMEMDMNMDDMNMDDKKEGEKMDPNMDMSGMEGGDGKMDMSMEQMNEEQMKLEMECVCKNKSFDVAKVMGLCSSCMGMQNDANKTMMESVNMVMSGCGFPSQSYAPEATSVLAGLQVEATMPPMIMQAGESSPSSSGSASNSMSGMDGMSGSSMMGSAGRLEVVTGIWGAGMVIASMGFGAGFVFGMF